MAEREAQKLFDDAGSTDSESELKVSNSYAERYDSWREKEELQKLQAKYGREAALDIPAAGEDESSSSEEDDDAEEITPAVEKQFFTTLAKLKRNDPAIYDPGETFFAENEVSTTGPCSKKKKKEKPMFLREYEREMLLSTGGVEDDGAGPSTSAAAPEQTYHQEQAEIRASFRSHLEDDSEGEPGDAFTSSLLQRRQKSANQQEQEEEDYKSWLAGQKKYVKDKNLESGLKGLKDAWSNPNIAKEEAFLRDYILSKRYLEQGDDSYVPSYDQLVHDSGGELSEDERTLGQQEKFENKFNFRFEEPDQDFIKRYPRTIANSLRKKDGRRRQAREDKKSRQEEDMRRKQEELKRLKALKRKEIMERLETLKEVVGNSELPFEAADLEDDFDPEAHDQKMSAMFNDDFYYDGEENEEKPTFSDDEENWDQCDPSADLGDSWDGAADPSLPACEQPDFVMDCEYAPRAETQPPAATATGRGRKKKRGGRLAQLLRRHKPRFDPQGDQRLAEYIDQYYRLDESLKQQPFKYRQVAANDFGLDVTEILMADERDLNRWVSVKRMSQYVRDEDERFDMKRYRAKAANTAYKLKVLPSLYTTEEPAEQDAENYKPQKKNKKKKRKRKDDNNELEDPKAPSDNGHSVSEEPLSKKRKKKRAAGEGGVCGDPGAVADSVQSHSPDTESGQRSKRRRRSAAVADNGAAGHTSEKGHQVDASAGAAGENGGGEETAESTRTGGKKRRRRSAAVADNGAAGHTSEKGHQVDASAGAAGENGGGEETAESTRTGGKKRRRRSAAVTDNGAAGHTSEKGHQVDASAGAAGENGGGEETAESTRTGGKKRRRRSAAVADNCAAGHTSEKGHQVDASAGAAGENGGGEEKAGSTRTDGKKRRGARPQAGTPGALLMSLSDARLEAFGLNPKKVRAKVRYGKKHT